MTRVAVDIDKNNEVALALLRVISKKFQDFPACVKLGVGSESGSVSKWKARPEPDRHQKFWPSP
jgi:hypothetical protein